jgi:hypothetical protein
MANVVITKTSNDITKVAYDDRNYYFSKNVLIYNENDAIHLKDNNFSLVIDYDDISDKLGSSNADEYIITLLESDYFKKGGGGVAVDNVYSTSFVEVTGNRVATSSDIVVASGDNKTKKTTLIPDVNSTTRIIALDNIGSIGDVINISGNVSQSTGTLEIMGGTSSLGNLTTGYNSVTVSNYQYADILKLADNSYRVTGDYTEVTSNVYAALNAANPIYETNATTGIEFDNPAYGTMSVETSDPLTGSSYVRATGSGAGGDWSLSIAVSGLEIGETYEVSIWLRQPVGSGAGVYWSDDFVETGPFPGGNITGGVSTWQQRTEASVANATTCFFGIYDATNTAGNYIDIDNISVRKVIA